MKLYKLFLSFALFVFSVSSFAQNNTNENLVRNYMKYWKARGRLIGDENNRDQYNGFMVVGGETGMSIPAEFRLPSKPGTIAGDADFDNVGYFVNGDCSAQRTLSSIIKCNKVDFIHYVII